MSRYFPTPRRCLALFLLLAQTAAAASLLSSLQTATSQSTAVAAVPAAFHPRDVRGLNLPNMRPGSNSNSGNFLQVGFRNFLQQFGVVSSQYNTVVLRDARFPFDSPIVPSSSAMRVSHNRACDIHVVSTPFPGQVRLRIL